MSAAPVIDRGTMSELGEAAAAYAARGWPVFPLSPGSKIPFKGSDGFKSATTNLEQVRSWWTEHPDANIGFATGEVAEVLDVDGIEGSDALEEWASESELGDKAIPDGPRVMTGGGGIHYYVKPFSGRNRAGMLPHVDWRGEGKGYSILPPSVTDDRYRWIVAPDEAEIPEATQPLRDLVMGPATKPAPFVSVRDRLRSWQSLDRSSGGGYGETAIRQEVENVLRATEGIRNQTLNDAGFNLYQLADDGELDRNEVTERLTSAARQIGLGDSEIEGTLRSAEKGARENPRSHDRKPARTISPSTQRSSPSSVEEQKPAKVWPKMDEAAYYGLVGEIVREYDPATEADPAAVILTLLAAFGNALNAGPKVKAGNTEHSARLFTLIVGDTAKARKGTSWQVVRSIMKYADREWLDHRRVSGLSSGEGVIGAVADPPTTSEDAEPHGRAADKRLFVVEEEMARALSASRREGNTLSSVIRQAWDNGDLSVLTKTKTEAKGAHISIVGHITMEELRAKLTDTDIANGWANRFLMVCAKRSKLLPEPPEIPEARLAAFGDQLAERLRRARTVPRYDFTDAARKRWAELYTLMDEDTPGGILGAITARPEAQTKRLALIYAVIDGSRQIDLPHLEAAWAVWRYCRASAEYVFGDALGDEQADTLLAALNEAKEEGLTARQQHELFNGHVTAARLRVLRQRLIDAGLAVEEKTATGGRPAMVLRARDFVRLLSMEGEAGIGLERVKGTDQ